MASKSSKEHPALAAVRASDTVKVKVGCSDTARDWIGLRKNIRGTRRAD